MKKGINFIAIDFETATGKRSSICEAGICVVKDGEIMETKSWLVQPEDNLYSYWNIQCHGIQPHDTEDSPEWPIIWKEIRNYLYDIPVLVAHNAVFDMSCIRKANELYHQDTPEATFYCTLRAARHNYKFPSNTLGALCEEFNIPEGKHHRAGDDAEMCARLFLRILEDANVSSLEELDYCNGIL